MSISDITNYLAISDRMASSGQPLAHQFDHIRAAGFQVVINLAMPDSTNAIANEQELVESLGMRYIHIPVPFSAPTLEHLRQFIAVMQEVSRHKLWIHCALNYRVSAFLYQYQRLIRGESEQVAKQAMFPGWSPDEVWQRFMQLSTDDVLERE